MHAYALKFIHELCNIGIGALDMVRDIVSESDKVRHYVQVHYIDPAKRRGERSVTVVAGEVHRALGLNNRVPLVCTALKLHRFHDDNRMVLSDVSGPPSKLSTTVRFTFAFKSGDDGQTSTETNPFWGLRGIAKDMFQKAGEWEDLIRQERKELSDINDKIGR